MKAPWRSIRAPWRSTVFIAVLSTMAGAMGVFVLVGVLERNERVEHRADIAQERAQRNSEAIEVGCILLANAIIRSGAAGMQDPSTPQAKLSALYVGVIARSMTPAERSRARKLAAQGAAQAPMNVPDCQTIARHPGSVKALALGPRPGGALDRPASSRP